MAVASVSPSRALRRPLRLDLRALVGVLLMLVATGGSILVWSAEQDTRSVLVVARELPAGTILTSGDVVTARARLDDAVYFASVPASQINTVVGKQLAEPAHANQVLNKLQISNRAPLAPDQMVFAIPVQTNAAAGGRIRVGDQVQVFATEKGNSGTATKVVLPRAVVYDTGRETSTSLTTSGSTTTTSGALNWITLVVTEPQAVELARARWSADLDVALLPAQQ